MTGFVGPFPPALAPLLYWNSTQAFHYHDHDEKYNYDENGHNDDDVGTSKIIVPMMIMLIIQFQ